MAAECPTHLLHILHTQRSRRRPRRSKSLHTRRSFHTRRNHRSLHSLLAALKAFNDEKNKDFRDRDLYVYCFSLPDGNFTAYQSPVLIGTNIKELKIPPNDPVGQRAYDAVAKAAEGEIVTFIYDFPKPGTKEPVPKETLEVRVGKQACGVSNFKS